MIGVSGPHDRDGPTSLRSGPRWRSDLQLPGATNPYIFNAKQRSQRMADDPNKRLAELRIERARLVDEREKARAEATQDIIAGKKPANTAAALAEC